MAVGFTPKHIEEFSLNNLTRKQFLALAFETAKKKKWTIRYVSESGLIAYTDNGMFFWNAEVTIKIDNGTANLKSASTGSSEMADWGKNKKNIAKFKEVFEELKLTLSPVELDLKYQELKENLIGDAEDALQLPPPTTTEKITNFLSIFKPRQGYFITPILLNLNIAIFLLMAISGVNMMLPDNESLLNWGANFRPMTLEEEAWRLLTNCFLHIGILHLLLNMYALVYIGLLLEPYLGKTRFIAAYLLTGIIASITSLWWHDYTISAGASGAIFGMYGVFLAMLTTNLIEKTARKALLTSIAVFVGYNLINGLKGGIDNAAHLGGLISGLFIGYALLPSLKKPQEQNLKLMTVGMLAFLVFTSSFFVYIKLPNDIVTYDAKMETFATYESMAMEIYYMPENTPKDKLLHEINERGLYYWNECIKLFEEIEKLDMPEEEHKRNSTLKEYVEIRIKSYELIYKAIEEDTDQYREEIEGYNLQIEAVLRKLKEI